MHIVFMVRTVRMLVKNTGIIIAQPSSTSLHSGFIRQSLSHHLQEKHKSNYLQYIIIYNISIIQSYYICWIAWEDFMKMGHNKQSTGSELRNTQVRILQAHWFSVCLSRVFLHATSMLRAVKGCFQINVSRSSLLYLVRLNQCTLTNSQLQTDGHLSCCL